MSKQDDPPINGWLPEAYYGIPRAKLTGRVVGIRTVEVGSMRDDLLDAMEIALKNFGSNNIPMLITPMTCCEFCDEFDKLKEPVRKKILLLMKLAGAEVA